MNTTIKYILICYVTSVLSCSNNQVKEQNARPDPVEKQLGMTSENSQTNNIIGEWQLQAIAGDANRNKILDDDERSAAITQVNDYIKFNADGTCLFYTFKVKGQYKTENQGGSQKIYIYDKDNQLANKYTLGSVNKNELVLILFGGQTFFHIYKKL